MIGKTIASNKRHEIDAAILSLLSAFQNMLDAPTVTHSLATAPSIKKLVDPAAEFLSTFFECNPIHLGFYKVQRELGKLKKGK